MHRIGIDLGGTKIDGILMGTDGSVLNSIRVSTPGSYFGTVQAIINMVRDLDDGAAGVYPVGLGTPGAWVEARGVMKNCNSTVLNGKPLLHDLQRLLNRPVRIANDANCMALSESVDGAGASATTVFGVILGTGVGGGLVVREQLVVGANLLAGEWGHNPFPAIPRNSTLKLDPANQTRICYCGRLNCIETFLSGEGLERTHSELHNEHLSAPEIGRGQSTEARQTIEEYVEQLALALCVIINIVDPDVIVIAGGLSNIKRIYEELPPLLVKYAFSSDGNVNVCQALHGDSSGRRGAAWLFPNIK